MALTKIQNTGIADDAVTTDKIENSTVLAADIAPGTLTNAKLSNSAITLNGSSVSLGGTASVKHLDWQAITVADGSTQLTAEAGKGYFLDTNTGVIEVLLPSSPTRGDTIALVDYGGTFGTNQCIINTGGQLIDSTTGPDFKLTTNNTVAELVYVDSNKGWLVKLNQAAGTTPDAIVTGDYDVLHIEATGGTITTSGDYKIHSFTGDGCFVVSQVSGTASLNEVSYLVVGGGGGGGSNAGGGGGAGGFRESKSGVDSFTASPKEGSTNITVTATTFPITVGGGGAHSATPAVKSSAGSNSVFSTITSAGGSGGGSGGQCGATLDGGGSGGGGRANQNNAGGAGNTPPTSPSQGNNGGQGGPPAGGGGGGGATAVGADGFGPGPGRFGGNGGAGATTHITGSPVAYSGGGAGGTDQGTPTPGSPGDGGDGGTGGGGDGGEGTSPSGPSVGENGTANTGGGAGGGSNTPGKSTNPTLGGDGGKGIVIIRYKFQ